MGALDNFCDIKEAALRMGCDHHYVRALVAQGRLTVDHVEPVNKSVNKVFLTKDSVKRYIEEHRERHFLRVKVTLEEEHAVQRLLNSMRQLPDW